MKNYYWKSEKMCALYACAALEDKLPGPGQDPDKVKEFGTTIFRWPDEEEGGYRYSYQNPVYDGSSHRWQPLGVVPAGTEEWAYCHTHPNGTFFSTFDTQIALGEKPLGVITMRCTVYLVTVDGAFWFDGRTELAQKKDRFGKLWGKYPSK